MNTGRGVDDAHMNACDDAFNPLVTEVTQMCSILVISHFFHLVLKPFGQPGPVAQILAGLVLGPSVLSRIKKVQEFFIHKSSAYIFETVSFFIRVMFMFLIGLETDVSYLKRNLRLAGAVSSGGLIVNGVLGLLISLSMIYMYAIVDERFSFVIVVMIIVATSASPVVIRLAAELNFATSNVGRLAISTSLINEASCLMLFYLFFSLITLKNLKYGFFSFVLTGGVIVLNKYLSTWLHAWNYNKKYVSDAQVLLILIIVVTVSTIIESYGYASTITCFLVGLMFPREGKTARTLLHKLTYAVHEFVLPIYFGYTGFQFDVDTLISIKNFCFVSLLILACIGGRLLGTMVASHLLKIPRNDGIILSLMLNLKGNSELILINLGPASVTWWGPNIHDILLSVVVLNTIIAGPLVSYILKREESYFAHKYSSLELHDPDDELRMMACAYGPHNISGQIALISAFSGSRETPISPYLMHLVELPKKRNTNLLYHQLEDGDQFNEEEDYGGNDVLEINDAVDYFTLETKILIHQVKVVSSFSNMYEEVCTGAEDLRLSVVFLPFHKHQRIDGKMENEKEAFRTNNQKVLRHSPCSVGILVHRGNTGFQQPHGSATAQQVVILFFGGPDDREALACSKKMMAHSLVNMTVMRFISVEGASTRQNSLINHASLENEEVLMSISNYVTEHEIDNVFMQDFHNRYVGSGKVGYVERYVNDGEQTVAVLKEIGDMYSLFIVGKGSRGHLQMTIGMSDWEECPELGAVGDILASSDFCTTGSILVIQQNRNSNRNHVNHVTHNQL